MTDVSTIFFFHFFQFLLIAMGMKAATSNNSCIWCKIHKNEVKSFFRNFDIEIPIASVTIEKPYFMYNNKYQGYKIECITYSKGVFT